MTKTLRDGERIVASISMTNSSLQLSGIIYVQADLEAADVEQAATAYRKALELDPYLVAALINLANIRYSRDELERAGAYRVYEDPADLLKHIDEVGGRR